MQADWLLVVLAVVAPYVKCTTSAVEEANNNDILEETMVRTKFKLSKGQLERSSEISGNIAVAWFSAGVIAPLFLRSQNTIDFIVGLVLSLIMATVFFLISLMLVKD